MEGAAILLIVLLAVFFVGVVIRDRIKGDGSQVKGPPTPKSRVLSVVLDGLKGKTHSDLGGTRYWYLIHQPPELYTLFADIEEFAYIRPTANSWLDGPFDKRDLAAQWRRKPAARRIWDAINIIVPFAIPAAFRADSRIQTVRFHIGNLDENERISTCRVSVEAKRGQHKDEWDWRYKRNGKGQLAPVAPHEDAPAPAARPRGFAADPREFELQVAQALQARGLSVEVTGGAGDEGVDIIARDPAPVTGGTYLVQCKRYAPDRKVGVAEVRELYGALQEKRASKGILATTASFSTPAIRFAEDKPLELLDGAQLAAFIGAPPSVPETLREWSAHSVADQFHRGVERRMKEHEERKEKARAKAAQFTETDKELLAASSKSDAADIAQILDRGANIHAVDERGNTPLHKAAGNPEPAVAALLLDRDANIHAVNERGNTPLHNAASSWRDSIAVASLLLDRGADIKAVDVEGKTPLHLAAEHNAEPAVAALLLARGADIEARDDNGSTPLRGAAAFNREPGVAALLLDRGADIEARDRFGSTPLHAVAFNVEPAVAALLLDHGADIEARDNDGATPLHAATDGLQSEKALSLLLERGADIEATDRDERTPLHHAANGEPLVITRLLAYGADLEARDLLGQTPYAVAVEHAERMIEYHGENDNRYLADANEALALLSGHIAPGDWLDWKLRQSVAREVAPALDAGAEIARLLDSGADINAGDDHGFTALHFAAANNKYLSDIELLLDRGADINAVTDRGSTPLHVAARRNAERAVVRLLLERGANIEAATDRGITPLHRAAAYNPNPAVVRLLMANGADPAARTHDGKTPYDLAAAREEPNEEILSLLHNAELNQSLQQAAANSDASTVADLLTQGADIEASYNRNSTPLHAAAAKNPEPAVAALLLDHGADIEAEAFFGVTPLHVAAESNANPAVVALLLDRGANIEARDRIGRTPLHMAAAGNAEPAVAALLLDRGANIEARDRIGGTPLHMAAAGNAEPAVAALLIDRGADIEAATDDGWTPLHLATARNAALLIDRGADIHARDDLGGTPLHAAASADAESAVIRLLLERGADPAARTHDGETPYDLAAAREEPDEEIMRLLRG